MQPNYQEVAKVAIALYAAETMALAAQGEAQTAWPEAFVPGALRLLDECYEACADIDVYLIRHPRSDALPVNARFDAQDREDGGVSVTPLDFEGPTPAAVSGDEPHI